MTRLINREYEMKELLTDFLDRALRYVDDLDGRRVAPSGEAVERLALLDEPLPEQATDPRIVLRMLDEIGSPATVASAGGRYFGFVTGGALPAALAANLMAGVWDQNAGYRVQSPVAAKVEDVCLKWLREVLGLPAGVGGGFTTGATMANFAALAAARRAALLKAGWNVEEDGLIGAPPVRVVVGDEVQAGNVNSGAFDPAREICAAARDAGAWVHVDGAFGLWAAASPRLAHLTAGFAEADSWATDAHKWLNAPYDSGIAFVREAEHLRAAMTVGAAYLIAGAEREPSQYTPDMSRRARGVEIWAALRSLGRAGLADLVERCCRHAARFAEGLQAAGYEILNDVTLNQALVSFGDDETTRRVIEAIQSDGTCWCGGTVWQGRAAMRVSVSSWATTEDDVERSLDAIIRIAASNH